MRLLLLLLLIGLGGASVRAAEPAGRTEAQWTAGAGFAAFVEASRSHEPTGVGRHLGETTAAGLAWQAGGFKASASAGHFSYDYTGVGIGAGRHASFALGHEVAAGGGTLSLELRQSRLWEGESQLDITSARLGWALKF
ncbi:MAG: hypothetical protein K2Y40_22915 [Reyranella sp.]|nr:hypothetical protein [Reyranella sp.]